MKRKYFAHSLEGRPVDEWHLLDEHLRGTAKIARSFADAFRVGDWVYLAGMWYVFNCRLIWNVERYSD